MTSYDETVLAKTMDLWGFDDERMKEFGNLLKTVASLEEGQELKEIGKLTKEDLNKWVYIVETGVQGILNDVEVNDSATNPQSRYDSSHVALVIDSILTHRRSRELVVLSPIVVTGHGV